MQRENYWTRLSQQRVSRRSMLRSAAAGGVGLTGLALVGCGDDDDDDAVAATTPATPAATTPAAPAAPAATPAAPAAPAAEKPKPGGTLRLSFQSLSHLDPHQENARTIRTTSGAMYNRLLRFDAAQLAVPDLAVSMPEQPDPLVIIFTIPPNVAFHNKPPVNGRTLKAADVAFSLERSRTPEPIFLHGSGIKSVLAFEATDDVTVRISTKTPDAVLVATLAQNPYYVFAPEALEAAGDLRGAAGAVGTGPFLVEEFSPDTGGKLRRHEAYFRGDGRPYLARIEGIKIADDWSQFLAGGLDFAAMSQDRAVGFADWEAVLADSGKADAVLFNPMEGLVPNQLIMNMTAPPFDDPRVRWALNLIYDRNPQIAYAYPIGGYPSIAMGPGHRFYGLPQEEILAMPGFRPAQRAQDIAAGVALLAEAGFTAANPLKFDQVSWSAPNRAIGIDQNQLAADTLTQLSGGVVQAQVKGLEFGVWKKAEVQHEFGMDAAAFEMGEEALVAVEKEVASYGTRNFSGINDPLIDQMIADARQLFDVEDRKEKLQELQRYIVQEDVIPIIWVGTGRLPSVAQGNVRGLLPFAEGNWDHAGYENLWLA